MYIPKVFEQTDINQLESIIVNYPFASLVTQSKNGLEVNHLPLFLDKSAGKYALQGHIAKANKLWKVLKDKPEVLVVFHGPNCYISPNYYPTKKEDGRAVPTWNYVAVHVKGQLFFSDDAEFKLEMLNNLTFQHEQKQSQPWSINDAPEEYIERMLPAIVGLKIEVSEITGQSKISQNQPEVNQQGIVDGLSAKKQEAASAIADLIKVNKT
ncbi:FMN-binding negative transcriptional regulator [uncultured Psychrosphaera sp.]|uniref:FMN-binding negative transcriptional regulator n=1 Tax=uncultured Psychrosphaera sp. TaxID=1403522 RepID=UPI0026197DCE|nr:FMN-binding negative transcriptional regulator [uncultured Psychrosphaera sp.]